MLNLWGIWDIFKSDFLEIRTNDFLYFTVCLKVLSSAVPWTLPLPPTKIVVRAVCPQSRRVSLFLTCKVHGLKNMFFSCVIFSQSCGNVFLRFQYVVAPKILYPFVFSATLSRQWFLHKLAKTSGLQNRDHMVHIQTSVVRISRSLSSFPVNYIVNK